MTKEELDQILNENTSLHEENVHLKGEVQHKDLVIQKLKHQLFGPKSEKFISDDLEQFIFNEIESEAPKAEPEQTELISYERKKKGRGVKKPWPDDIEREEVVIDLPESEKTCPHDGTLLNEIGFDITEKLKVVPARTVLVVEKKKKYACPCCESHVAQAKANAILPGTIATPELLSF